MATTDWKNKDGIPLKLKLKRSERNIRIRAALLVSPLFLFLLLTFIFPITQFLYRSVDNSIFYQSLPQTMQAIEQWEDDGGLPSEEVFKAFALDVKESYGKTTKISKVARSLNYRISGARGKILKVGRNLKKIPLEDFDTIKWKDKLSEINEFWADRKFWVQLKTQAGLATFSHYYHAMDKTVNNDFDVVSVDENSRIHQFLFKRTFFVAFIITFLCLIFGYPIAYLLATLPLRISNLLMICVLLPFWTSLLVRTSSWIVLLQDQGVINSILVWIGFISDDNRLSLINNQTGTIIAMTHILMPFMILPVYAVMRGISPTYVRAAISMGAHPFRAFYDVYVPQTIPGIGAGAILIFILAIGYYITPSLVGGSTGQLISNTIAYHMQYSLNWGLASSLSMILLGSIVMFYILYFVASKFIAKIQQNSL